MDELVVIYLTVGAIFLTGLLTDLIGRRTRLPRVTLLLVAGFLIGPSVFDLLPYYGEIWFRGVTEFALTMVGFLLGGHFTPAALRRHGRTVLILSLSVVAVTALVVGGLSLLAGASLPLALLLGGIATATDPVATEDVIQETGASGAFSETLLGIVAIDDAWALILFSALLAIAESVAGVGSGGVVVDGFWEVGGAFLVGGLLGVPMAYLTGRVTDGEPTLVEALGFVLLCCGVALWLDISFILAAMTMGAVVVNMAHHHGRPFHAIEGIEWPFKVLFFLLAGASLELNALLTVGGLGTVYLILRIVGRVAGASLGATWAGAEGTTRHWMGAALLPQAGVAIGMALVASEALPALRSTLLPIVIGTTVVFEIGGPLLTRLALARSGETEAGRMRGRTGSREG